jgi:hypothetical protein
VSTSGSGDRLRLLRDIGQAEKELDKALALLDRTQRAMVDVGARIMELHATLHQMRRTLELPHPGKR